MRLGSRRWSYEEHQMNTDDMALAVIEEQADRTVRRAEIDGVWYFSVIDVIVVLTDSVAPSQYWTDMKRRMRTCEGWNELQANCLRLPLIAADGKKRLTDAADLETMLRIVQSVPSPKAEPVKRWLARVGAGELTGRLSPTMAARSTSQLSDDDLLALAEYHEHMSRLYRQQASLKTRLETVEAVTRSHDQQLIDILLRLETLESSQTVLPDMLALLRPESLSKAHQTIVRRWVNDLAHLT